MSAAKPLKPVPDQYKLLTEDLVLAIGKKAETLMALAGELGNDNILLETGNVQVQIFKTIDGAPEKHIELIPGNKVPLPSPGESQVELTSWESICKKCKMNIIIAQATGNTLIYYQPACPFCGTVNHKIGNLI